MRRLFTSIDFRVRDLAVREGVDETVHSLQATPFCFSIDLVRPHCPLSDFVRINFGVVATSVLFTRILRNHCTLARGSNHQLLVLIALGFPDIVSVNLSLALFDFIVVCFGCSDARVLGPEVLVQETTCQATSPSSSGFLCAFRAMDVPTTDSH